MQHTHSVAVVTSRATCTAWRGQVHTWITPQAVSPNWQAEDARHIRYSVTRAGRWRYCAKFFAYGQPSSDTVSGSFLSLTLQPRAIPVAH